MRRSQIHLRLPRARANLIPARLTCGPRSRGVFPLELRWQTIARGLVQRIELPNEFLGIGPAHVVHWVSVGAVLHAGTLKARWVVPHYPFPLALRDLVLTDLILSRDPDGKARHGIALHHLLTAAKVVRVPVGAWVSGLIGGFRLRPGTNRLEPADDHRARSNRDELHSDRIRQVRLRRERAGCETRRTKEEQRATPDHGSSRIAMLR